MTIKTTTHLNFRGQARDALAFYHSVFGGQQMLITYKDANAVQDPQKPTRSCGARLHPRPASR